MTFFTVPEANGVSATQSTFKAPPLTNITPSGRSRVYSDNNPTLEPESKRRRAVLNLDPARRVRVVVSV